MISLKLPFCCQTVFLATGIFYLFDHIGPTPSPQLTLLFVLISAVFLKALASGRRRFKAWRQQRLSTSASTPTTPATILITEEEEALGHENLSQDEHPGPCPGAVDQRSSQRAQTEPYG
jgi:hypothetical protein